MNCSMPGLPVHHQLLEFTQTHVHRVGDAIQPSRPPSSPSAPAPNPSQHQSFPVSQHFTWGGQSIGVSALASVFPVNTQDCSPLEIPWTVARQTPLSMGFPRQEHWSGLPFPSPEELPNPGIEPTTPALAGRSFITEPPGKPNTPFFFFIEV